MRLSPPNRLPFVPNLGKRIWNGLGSFVPPAALRLEWIGFGLGGICVCLEMDGGLNFRVSFYPIDWRDDVRFQMVNGMFASRDKLDLGVKWLLGKVFGETFRKITKNSGNIF